MSNRRRAILLLVVLVTLALLGTLLAPLAALTGTETLASAARGDALRHRLAVDSVVAVLADWLAHDTALVHELDRSNAARRTFALGDLPVEVVIQDDTAKLPLALADAARLRDLQGQLGLALTVADAAPRTGCLDDLFVAAADHEIYGGAGEVRAWAAYVTPFGRSIHAYRAAPAVLEAGLTDLRVGLGTVLARRRERQVHPDLAQLLAEAELPEPLRRAVQERLTACTERYSLLVRSGRGPEARQHYVVVTAADPPTVLLAWEVAP